MRQKGFTLMEMMAVLATYTLIMGIAFTAIRLNDLSRDNVNIQLELYNFNKQIHNTIGKELSLSSKNRINTVDAPCTQTLPCFQVPIGTDDTYAVIWGADNQAKYWIHYKLNGINLVREILKDDSDKPGDLDSERIIGTDVNTLSINADNNLILINTNIRKKRVMGDYLSLSMESRLYVRNE